MRGSAVFHSCLVLSVALFAGCSKHPTDEQIQSDLCSRSVKPLVERVYPLSEAGEALRHLIDDRPFGKVVLAR